MVLSDFHTRDQIGAILNATGLNGVGVEIGVERGVNAELILATSSLSCLLLVDPWEYVPESPPVGFGIGYSDWPSVCSECVQRTQRFGDRVRIMKMTSADASREVADKSLDFVYIDANHMSPHIDEDIKMWIGKLNTRGIIGGHDYYNKHIDGVFQCDVKAVVDNFFLSLPGKVHITEDDVPSWYFIQEGVGL